MLKMIVETDRRNRNPAFICDILCH